jgi:hypothetical protein
MNLAVPGRQAYHRGYYAAHRAVCLARSKRYYAAVKSDPAAYGSRIEQERLYKRRRFGWKRTYRRRRIQETP